MAAAPFTPYVHSVELINDGGGRVRIVIHAELCEQGCGERVRYWNSEAGGESSCGCCQEGPESLGTRVAYSEVVYALIFVALDAVKPPGIRFGIV